MRFSSPLLSLRYVLLVSLFGTLILFLSLFKLTESPSVWYDEGIYVQSAHVLEQTGKIGLQLDPHSFSSGAHITVGYPLLAPLAGVFAVFGYGILQARLLMVFFILSFVCVSFLLVRRLHGTRYAFCVLALLSVFPPLYGNGKSVLGEVPGLFYLMLFLLFFSYAKHSAGKTSAVLAGLFLGLAVATKPVFLLLLPAVFVTGLFFWRDVIGQSRRIVGGIIAFLFPVGGWLLTQFSGADSLTDIFSFYANPYEISNLWNVILHNLHAFVSDTGPLFLLLLMVCWGLAFFIRLYKKEQLPSEEMMLFFFILLSLVAYMRTEGWYRYLFPYQALALLFFPYTLSYLARFVSSFLPRAVSQLHTRVTPALLCLLFVLSLYQVCFDSWVARFYTSEKTAFWQSYFKRLPEGETVFFYDTPEVALFSRDSALYQYLHPAGGEIGAETLALIDAHIPTKIILETDRWQTLQQTERFSGYRIESEMYKYTVLEKAD